MARRRGGEVVLRRAGLVVLRGVGERLPRLAVGGGFEAIAVGVVLRLPIDVNAGDFLFLAEVHLPRVAGTGPRRAPTRVGVTVNGVGGEVTFARLLARRLRGAGDGEVRSAINQRDDDGFGRRVGLRCGRGRREQLRLGRGAGDLLRGRRGGRGL